MTTKRSIKNGVEQLKEENDDDKRGIAILESDDGDGCKDTISGDSYDSTDDVDAALVIDLTGVGQ